MPIEDTSNSYEYKLKAAGLTEPLTTYLSDPLDPDRLKAGFPAVKTDPVTGKDVLLAGSSGKTYPLGTNAWRGVSQAMSLAVQGFVGGSNWSHTTRSRHRFNVKFKRVRAVIQTFYPAGSNPIIDTNFADDYNFQVGLEQGYTNGVTGIAPRKMFTFGGAETAQYLAASPPSSGYILSDVMELDTPIAAQEFFGLWTTVENPAAGANKIPYQRNISNFLPRNVGYIQNATSNIANNIARDATSLSAATTAQTGAAAYFTPCMLLVETDSGLPFVVAVGDSITYGVGEGNAGSGTTGDCMGSALGNMGFAERAINEKLGYSCMNISKGSDGDKYLFTAANWAKRSQLMALANPTHVFHSNIHNDLTPTITVNGWVTATAYAKWDVASANSNIYVCTKAGTSGAISPTGTGGGIVDGTVIWTYLMPFPAISGSRGSSLVIAQMAAVNAQIKAALPDVKIVGMTGTPDASSTDSWTTAANQTPATYWGDGTSRRGLANGLIRAKTPILQLSAYVDPNTVAEDSYPAQTSKWAANGVANNPTPDGTHPSSVMYDLMANTVTADKFI